MGDSDVVFENLLRIISVEKTFHKRYNVVFNFLLSVIGSMAYTNIVLILTAPDHWCKVPGRDINTSQEEWKNLTIPRELNSYGQNVFSACKMINNYSEYSSVNDMKITECNYGYEYDTTWFKNTVVSSSDWVCDKSIYVPNIFAGCKLGEILGGLSLGYMSDRFGRRFVYFISLAFMTIGRTASIFMSKWYTAFLTLTVLANIPSNTLIQSCMVTIMEISLPEDRAKITQIQNFGWSTANCLLPLLYWYLQDWVGFALITTMPLWMYYILAIFLIESPRWLLSQGENEKCFKELSTIAKINNTEIPHEIKTAFLDSQSKTERVYGIGSLFTHWRLSKNTLFLVLGSMSSVICYHTMFLNAMVLSGNPFLNFFLQGLAEIPSYLLARIFCDTLGRRLTGISGFFLSFICYLIVILGIGFENNNIELIMVIIARFGVSITFFVTCLQSVEIFPTCVRHGAASLSIVSGNILCIFGPYIVYLGSTIDARLPYLILSFACITGIFSELLLPETLHMKLPQTLQEARRFGKDQNYFSYPKKKEDNDLINTDLLEKQLMK